MSVKDDLSQSLASRLAVGLAKLGLAARHRAWEGATTAGITPTQGQILAYLLSQPEGARPSEISIALGVTTPTISDSVAALVAKGLIERSKDPADGRAVRIRLTRPGKELAEAAAGWMDVLLTAVDALSPAEQLTLLRTIITMIRALQDRGAIPVARMCVNCRYFQPFVHNDQERPHHCAFVGAPFGDGALRIECPDFVPAPAEDQVRQWERFSAGRVPG